jgi:hypothetical protein
MPLPTATDKTGWPYLLMSQWHGERLVDAWPALSLAERDRMADELGIAIAALHATSVRMNLDRTTWLIRCSPDAGPSDTTFQHRTGDVPELHSRTGCARVPGALPSLSIASTVPHLPQHCR